jgi:hypothetical protein
LIKALVTRQHGRVPPTLYADNPPKRDDAIIAMPAVEVAG